MNYADIPAKLARVENLREFARTAGLTRNTLLNVKAGKPSTVRTLEEIAAALREHKPKLRKAP